MLARILIVPLLMVALSHASYAKEPCEREDSTVALNECSKFGFDEADRELNLEYQQVLKDLRTLAKASDDVSKMKAALVKAQRAWVAFRDADCDAVTITTLEGVSETLCTLAAWRSTQDSVARRFATLLDPKLA